MKPFLKILSIVIFLISIGLWLVDGANTGWTTTEQEIQKIDEITEIEYTVYEKKLTFGIELPVAGTIAAAFVFAASLFFKPTKQSTSLS